MKYLATILVVTASIMVGCTQNDIDDEIGIDKADYEIPPNGIQSIEKDKYEVPPNG